MRKFTFNSIRTRLTYWFLFLTLVPLLLVLIATYFQRVEVIETKTFDKLTAIRDLKVDRLTSWLTERVRDLHTISSDKEFTDLELVLDKDIYSKSDNKIVNNCRRIVNRYSENYQVYNEIFIIDPLSGKVLVSSNSHWEGDDRSQNEYFTEPMKSREMYFKNVYYSATLSEYSMAYSIPIFCSEHAGEHIVGILVARIDLHNSLYKILLDRVGLGETGETLIVNEDVVALNELRWYDNAPLKLKISAEPAVNAAEGKTGITITTDYRGEKILAAYTHIPKTNWGFVCKQDLYELNTQIREMIRNFALIFLITALIITFIALRLSRSISRPVVDMNLVAKKFGSGDYSIRNKYTSQDELGSLASQFNAMADLTESRNIIQTGVVDISKHIVRKTSLQEFGDSLLKQMMKITDASMSTFYILNESTSEFEHFVSIGANKEMLKPFDSNNPEGEFGNAIANKEIFYLKNINKDTIFKFVTTAGELIPSEIITIPIIADGTVVAIVSLITHIGFSAESYNTIEQSWITINSIYSNLMTSERTRILSEHLSRTNQQLETKSLELQTQSEELQQTSEELQEQNLELEMQREQVEEANRLKSEFLSNMSHELRTPLNSIMALSRVLIMKTKDKLSEEENGYLEIVERNGKQLLSLINDILDLSKIEAGKMEMYPTLFSLKETLSRIKDSLRPLAQGKNLQLTLSIEKDLPNINTDEVKLRQILQNVIGNAIKFTESGSVNILVDHDEENVKIVVKDTGIGIVESSLPQIFEEFRQVDGSSSRPYEGTGLGLAIAAKLIKALNGDIYAESEFGKGSTFTITVPKKWHAATELQSSKLLQPENIINKTKSADIKLSVTRDKTILVVDDNPKFIEDISNYLKIAGYNTISATSGKEALALAKKHKLFAITLDVVMPEMDGWEVLQELKSNDITSDIPVVVVSISDDRETGFAMGAIGFIQKPVNRDLLISELKKLHENPETVMIVDDNEFDRVSISEFIKAENINTISATSGKECITLLQDTLPDVLVLDLVMPEMNGFQVLREIRKTERIKDLPIIIVTAKDLNNEESKLLSGNVSSVLSKSESTPVELYHEIRHILAELNYLAKQNKIKEEFPNILIVEDNESVIIQLKTILKDKYNVNIAKGGKEALEFVSHTIPDGIILDLMMPEVDGFEVLENIRNTNKTKGIPVLILTAKDLTKDDLSKLSANNIQQLVQKGDVDIEELMHKIKLMFTPATKPEKITKVKKLKKKTTVRKKKVKGIPRVLIIEDNPDNMVTIKAILGNKYDIYEADDGVQGLNMIINEEPDLVLLDISLPEMDGFEVLRKVRKSEKLEHIPVIAVTARAMKEDKDDILAAGFDGYVTKPIDQKVLLLAIKGKLGV